MRRQRIGTYPLPVSFVLLLVGGFGLAAGAAPRHWWFAVILGLACFWAVVRRARWLRAFGWGFAIGFLYFYLHFDWAQVASGLIAARAALAALEALFFGVTAVIWAGLWRWAERRRSFFATALALIASAAAWAGLEDLRSYLPFGGLPWGLLGYQLLDSPFVRLAALGGSELVGAAAVICALSGALVVMNLLGLHPLRATAAAITCAVVTLATALTPLGLPKVPSGELRVAVVQGNAPAIGSVPREDWSIVTTRNHVAAVAAVLTDQPDLVILPESTSERDYREDSESRAAILGLARESEVPLLLGTQRYFQREGTWLRTNDYVVQYPDGVLPGESDTYSKQRPVPFGEYIPLRSLLGNISNRLEQISIDMIPGDAPAQLSVKIQRGEAAERELRVAVPICFEVAYGQIVSAGVARKDGQGIAELLIVPTSNVNFGYSQEAFQQFDITRFRAIENGRTAIQVSTMGTSGVVTAQGDVLYQTKLFERDARVVMISLYDHVTPAAASYSQRLGVTYICLALSALIALNGYRRRKNQ